MSGHPMNAERPITYRAMRAGEEQQVCDLVVRVFHDFVAPLYSPEGVHEFLTYAADPGQLHERLQSNRFVLVAESQDQIVGAIEVRNHDHISLFFVDGQSQRKGIGWELWRRALGSCLVNRPDLTRITVHSSPNAVEAYQKLGFQPEGPEQTVNGIRFVPMALPVRHNGGQGY
jgi:ribosomal protein S18 acetylase RimI-like enzyme